MQNIHQRKLLTRRVPVYFGVAGARNIGFVKSISADGLEITSKYSYDPQTRIDMSISSDNCQADFHGIVSSVRRSQTQEVPGAIPSSEMNVEVVERPRCYLEFLHDVLEFDIKSRHDKRFEQRLRVSFASSAELLEEYTHNISMGGMFVETGHVLERGALVELSLLVPELMKVLHAEARVVHVVDEGSAVTGAKKGIGLQFTKFDSEDRKLLENYIRQLEKQQTAEG